MKGRRGYLQKKSFILAVWFIFLFSFDLDAGQDTITISRVSDNLSKQYQELKPFIDYLANKLSYMDIREGRVVLAGNNKKLIQLVKEGKVDMVTETPFSSMVFIEEAGMKALLRRWKQGVPTYKSVIFTKKATPINSLGDLKGKVIAFEDPGSTTGYFLPKAGLIKSGFELVRLNNYKEKPPFDKIGYCFAQTEANIGHWVHNGFVDAGVLSDLEYKNPEEVPARFISDFRVIYESEEVPRNLILVRPDMPPKLQEEIKRILLDMKLTEEGQRVLLEMSKTNGFDEIPGGPEEMFKRFGKDYNLIKSDLNNSN